MSVATGHRELKKFNNNCGTCSHKKYPDGGHCYMFKNEPVGYQCMKHDDFKDSPSVLIKLMRTSPRQES